MPLDGARKQAGYFERHKGVLKNDRDVCDGLRPYETCL
jgi:hypothetical protein